MSVPSEGTKASVQKGTELRRSRDGSLTRPTYPWVALSRSPMLDRDVLSHDHEALLELNTLPGVHVITD